MRRLLLLLTLLLLSGLSVLQAQQHPYTSLMNRNHTLVAPVYERRYTGPLLPSRLSYVRHRNSIIGNPGVRFALQNLEREDFGDRELADALKVVTRYMENARLKYAIDYVRRYGLEHMGDQEKAIRTLAGRISADSLLQAGGTECPDMAHMDLKAVVSHICSDSNYLWLKEASRDSVLVEIATLSDTPLKVWMDNGRTAFYRFWPHNKLGDTIGTWIQVLPGGKKLKVYTDEDVSQNLEIEQKRQDAPGGLPNPLREEYHRIVPLHPGEVTRRYWTYYSEVELALSQGKLANWSNGGENSLSMVSNLRYFWNYNKERLSWENWAHYRFGFMKNGDEDLRKNEDRFELNSKLGFKAFKHWYYTAQFNTVTQLFNSYDYPKEGEKKLVANFMSPGHFTLSLGMDFKPTSAFSMVISPIAGKWDFVRDTAKIAPGRFGIEAGKRYRRVAGAQLNIISRLSNLFNFMDMSNEFKVFMSYESKDKYVNRGTDGERKKSIPLTVNWKLNVNFKINYFMNASIYTETIYDESYSRKLQFKERLNLGVKFRF